MDTETACAAGSMITIGIAWVATGAVSLGLPAGRRLETILALVVGGGVGLAGLGFALALEPRASGAAYWPVATLLSCVAGALAVFVALGTLVARDRRQR